MLNKNFSTSNADTEDDEESERKLSFQQHIIDVWAHNFKKHIKDLRLLSKSHTLIALDTQFPGNPIKREDLPLCVSPQEADYQLLWHNIQNTKLIQIGFSLSDPTGNFSSVHTYQFHLDFNLQEEKVDNQSIALLHNAGIPFEKLPTRGIPQAQFLNQFIGITVNKELEWVAYHGCYDFAYLLKLIKGQSLPGKAEDFYTSIHVFFRKIYDLKEIVKDHNNLRGGGLNGLAKSVGCERIGPKHQAGSDSLLTLNTHYQLRKILGSGPFEQHANIIYGIKKPQQKMTNNPGVSLFPSTFQTRGPLFEFLQSSKKKYSPFQYFG